MTIERASVAQHVQIGVEATPGTAVAASKQLRSLGITPTPHINTTQYRPAGQKYVGVVIEGEEWVEAAIAGQACYDELVYPLSSVLGAATVTAGSGAAAGTNTWVFSPNVFTADNAKTFTVQHGDPNTRADQFSYAIVNELQFQISRQDFQVSGSMLGQSITDGITFTSNPTLLPLVPITPNTVSVFADTTALGIGTTQLGRVLTCDWHIANKNGPLWALDATKPSYAAVVELVPTLTATMLMEADANGMAFLNYVRQGQTMYVRFKATGPNIGATTTPYSWTLDMPVKVTGTQGFSDSNGVYAIQWEFVLVDDTAFNGGAGGAMLMTVVNSLASL